jgi:glycosyltransferase involved in cell wall biosynthesis
MTTKILYQGQITDPSGYAVAGRGYIRSVCDYIETENLDIDFKVVSMSADAQNALTKKESEFLDSLSFQSKEEMQEWVKEEDFHYVFHHPPVYAWKLDATKFFAARSATTTCVTVWETDEMPPVWNDILTALEVDRIIVPCQWNKDSFDKSLEKLGRPVPVKMVPHLINEEFVASKNSMPVPQQVINENDFNILTVGQWTDRKALINVVKAFLMEFKDNEDCNLIIKTYGNIQDPRPEYQEAQKQEMANQISVLKRSILNDSLSGGPKCKMHLLYGLFPKDQMNYLYEKSDLFALFSRAEGFGLPIAEALTHATPVIVHDKGGHVGFVDPVNNYIVDSYPTPAHCTVFPFVYSCDSNWFETNYLSARTQLRSAYKEWKENPESFSQRGPAAKQYMLEITGDSLKIGKNLVDFIMSEDEQED